MVLQNCYISLCVFFISGKKGFYNFFAFLNEKMKIKILFKLLDKQILIYAMSHLQSIIIFTLFFIITQANNQIILYLIFNQQMQRTSNNTPIKTKYQYTAKSNYSEVLTAKSQNSMELSYAKELSFAKDYETLKGYARNLENQQRNLVDEIERLKVQNNHNQSKFMQELIFKDETFHQYKNEKNNQINQLHVQFEEEAGRILREKDSQYEALERQYKKNQGILRQKIEKVAFLENLNTKLNLDLQNLGSELIKNQDAYNQLNDRYQKLSLAQKNLSVAFKQLQAYKNQIEQEVRLCIQIEAEKTQAIELLQMKLTKSETNEKNLLSKLEQISYNFERQEGHLKEISENLNSKQGENSELKSNIDKLNHQILIKERENVNLGQINLKLNKQMQEAMRVEKIRESEILGLIAENERLYNQINLVRHKLHDCAIKYNFTV